MIRQYPHYERKESEQIFNVQRSTLLGLGNDTIEVDNWQKEMDRKIPSGGYISIPRLVSRQKNKETSIDLEETRLRKLLNPLTSFTKAEYRLVPNRKSSIKFSSPPPKPKDQFALLRSSTASQFQTVVKSTGSIQVFTPDIVSTPIPSIPTGKGMYRRLQMLCTPTLKVPPSIVAISPPSLSSPMLSFRAVNKDYRLMASTQQGVLLTSPQTGQRGDSSAPRIDCWMKTDQGISLNKSRYTLRQKYAQDRARGRRQRVDNTIH